jgi:hypothetical protein
MSWSVFVVFGLICFCTFALVRLVVKWEEQDRRATLEQASEALRATLHGRSS